LTVRTEFLKKMQKKIFFPKNWKKCDISPTTIIMIDWSTCSEGLHISATLVVYIWSGK
jgi:hypothetical protein